MTPAKVKERTLEVVLGELAEEIGKLPRVAPGVPRGATGEGEVMTTLKEDGGVQWEEAALEMERGIKLIREGLEMLADISFDQAPAPEG